LQVLWLFLFLVVIEFFFLLLFDFLN